MRPQEIEMIFYKRGENKHFLPTSIFVPSVLRAWGWVGRAHGLFENTTVWADAVLPVAELVRFKAGQNHTQAGKGWIKETFG